MPSEMARRPTTGGSTTCTFSSTAYGKGGGSKLADGPHLVQILRSNMPIRRQRRQFPRPIADAPLVLEEPATEDRQGQWHERAADVEHQRARTTMVSSIDEPKIADASILAKGAGKIDAVNLGTRAAVRVMEHPGAFAETRRRAQEPRYENGLTRRARGFRFGGCQSRQPEQGLPPCTIGKTLPDAMNK